jgi:hypothetical protein
MVTAVSLAGYRYISLRLLPQTRASVEGANLLPEFRRRVIRAAFIIRPCPNYHRLM